jgi:signal transduction histidine kinase/CheY-like chemotaxis protein
MSIQDEEELLRSAALENARAILHARRRAEEELLAAQEVLREQARELEILNSIGMKLASNLDSRILIQAVTDAATELCGAKFGAFFYNVIDKDGESYQLFTLSGAPREAFEKFGLPRNTPIFDPTFRGDGIVRSEDITQDPRYGQMAPHHGMPNGHLAVRSYLAAPVTSRSGEVMGGLFFGHPDRSVFSERAERLIAGIAAQAAIAIDNARLYESERHARAEAERLSALKDEFLATLSHELRTPLSVIVGWTHMISSHSLGPEEYERAIEIIDRNARAQTRLIEDLLDMSRITAGNMRLDVQTLALAPVVDAAVESAGAAADAKGIRLERILDPKAGPISGDPGRLQQVIWNLLSNAIKFTPRGGKVQVLLQRVNSHVELSVADTGVGIAPEFLPYVFDRFRQADGSTTRRQGGLGLGLAIAKQLVELHGGSLRAASRGVDKGATFTIHLPLAVVHRSFAIEDRVHPAADGPEAHSSPLPSLKGLTVLAVDDQADSLELLRRVLENCDATVLTASNVSDAMGLAERKRPQLIVTDLGMPGADGFDLLKRVRALGPIRGGDIPVIALTAFARAEDRMRVLRAGFRMHIAKPVDPLELCVAVANAVGRAG